jgi:hypothetical protein
MVRAARPPGKKAPKHRVNAIDPGRRYRALTDELAITGTIANRNALAAECLLLDRFDEASHPYDEILMRPLGEEPVYMLGRARAEFGAGQPAGTVATLDELRRRWPDYQSAEGISMPARWRRPTAPTRRSRNTRHSQAISGHRSAGALRHAAQPARPRSRGQTSPQ